MRKVEEVVVPATTKKVTKKFCDICGADINQERLWNCHTKCYYDNSTPDFEPESEELDFCVKCMKNKVIPLLKITFNIER